VPPGSRLAVATVPKLSRYWAAWVSAWCGWSALASWARASGRLASSRPSFLRRPSDGARRPRRTPGSTWMRRREPAYLPP